MPWKTTSFSLWSIFAPLLLCRDQVNQSPVSEGVTPAGEFGGIRGDERALEKESETIKMVRTG